MTTTPAWKQRLSFLDAEPVTHMVNGHELHFYPASLGVMFELRDAAKDISSAIAVLFTSNRNDAGSIQREFVGDPASDKLDREIVAEAAKLEVLQFRQESRAKAVSSVIETALAPDNIKSIGRLIMDSLPEIFPRESRDNPPPVEFMQSLTAPQAVAMLIGVAKANKGVFGPLADRLGGILATAERAINAKLNETAGASGPLGPTSNGSGEGETPGSSFKINSAGSESEATAHTPSDGC